MFLSGFDFGFLFSDSIAAFVSFQAANIVLPDIENDESTRNFSIVSTGVGIMF